jgi:dolichol-phosphate mannosyltransferase
MKSILICLPTYNEAGNIISVLKSLDNWRSQEKSIFVSIVQIDDNSTDSTRALAKGLRLTNYELIERAGKLGLGSAYLTAFSWGIANSFDYFVEFDADGSHHIEQLAGMLELASSNDLVIGTRWMPGGRIENWTRHRRAISRFGTLYASKALRLPYRDLTSGYRVLSAKLARNLVQTGLVNKGYGFQIVSVLRASEFGMGIAEFPITFTERTSGESKMSAKIAFEAFLSVTRWGLRKRSIGINRR